MVAHNCHGKTKNLMAKTKTSQQNQKPHDKNITAKPKYLTAKTKYLVAKPNTSLQEQNSFGFAMGICFCREVFGFAVRFLVLSSGFWFCHDSCGPP